MWRTWSETEENVRRCIRNNLNLPSLKKIDIELALRVKSIDDGKCTNVVKFTRFKNRDQILYEAKKMLLKMSYCFVKVDFTNRVKLFKRELGKRLVEAMVKGQYAAMHLDKLFFLLLFISHKIYT